ncbi:FadR/GntR family transcriptional regulator [Sphingomonas sp. S2-65]|uniref:FadR/GntR family transcriptional regulator n=1 Tax=Sphingomonas sp. S2-65 TaxID=2903960 RepID=UPI001F26C091|nr:FadR/GntR family transcriptional regulator [Sphingomonas sp. S2-65]UYY58162.1 FadR family transcriptional regulator [Sphingomonas sp. S2-65]
MTNRRLFQDVAEQIVALIEEGAFPRGSRLPGERELSERFGVSRVTIREAEIALQASGRLQIKTGSGVYVADRPKGGSDHLPIVSAFELTEARALFESEAAALAAPIISDGDIAVLRDLLEQMSRDGLDDAALTAIDQTFHLTIASASGNKAIIHVIETLWRLRTELPEVRRTHSSVCHHDSTQRHDEHGAIVEALARRDAQSARLAMRQHFGRLLEAMLDATEQREIAELKERAAQSRARFTLTTRLS